MFRWPRSSASKSISCASGSKRRSTTGASCAWPKRPVELQQGRGHPRRAAAERRGCDRCPVGARSGRAPQDRGCARPEGTVHRGNRHRDGHAPGICRCGPLAQRHVQVGPKRRNPLRRSRGEKGVGLSFLVLACDRSRSERPTAIPGRGPSSGTPSAGWRATGSSNGQGRGSSTTMTCCLACSLTATRT